MIPVRNENQMAKIENLSDIEEITLHWSESGVINDVFDKGGDGDIEKVVDIGELDSAVKESVKYIAGGYDKTKLMMFGDPHGMFYMGVSADDAENYEYGGDRSCSPFEGDKDYYHIQIRFTKIVNETDKSYLIEYDGENIWVPKKICRYEDFDKCIMKVHRHIFSQIIYKSVEGSPVLQHK
jgi:hypothetical protein